MNERRSAAFTSEKRGGRSALVVPAALGARSVEAVAVGLDVDDLGAVNEAVDERHDARGVGKDLTPC